VLSSSLSGAVQQSHQVRRGAWIVALWLAGCWIGWNWDGWGEVDLRWLAGWFEVLRIDFLGGDFLAGG
jgi:hypothetical protein